MADRRFPGATRARLRRDNAIGADRNPAWRNWLTAAVAAWIVFTHLAGIVAGDPQSLAAEAWGWGVGAQWFEHWLVLGVMLAVLAFAIESLAFRHRGRLRRGND
ncbi:hypothetical protein HD597_005057 [Nonomuraea thailandensis]|uniref:Uncharacterized protein n=1 Tax=Nonomuraea thailandensis TaxID=1188745 RepID=A0A9X2GGB4_9ACTN|nr:hypothetical protein [Nonomuraea thailandensis]MCP2358037.1 hypothetical protein [Nonomuraea thailandensis]